MKKIAVLGGGVAGMSTAHELIKRGYEVEVYERNNLYCGGKARSVNVPGTNLLHPNKYLPGEHGFRFFPGFYKHVTSTMKEIPFVDANGMEQKEGCFGNLVPTTRIMLARYGKQAIVTVSSFPKNKSDIKLLIKDIHGVDTGLSKEEEEFFVKKMWQLMTSSQERRDAEYEDIGWWEYLEADRFSKAYQTLLVEGLTRTLVAAQAKTASTKTGGDILLQLIYNSATPGISTDRVLNGPTNDRWLDPWLAFLEKSGVKYHFNHTVKELQIENGRIKSATVQCSGKKELTVEADHFVLAVPVEVAAPLVAGAIAKRDTALKSLKQLAESVNWMNGIQFYLNEDVVITNGHCIYSDSEWAITSISQMQFWKGYDLENRYNGKVKGVLSVDVSDWKTTKYRGTLAEDLPANKVARYVWEQIENSLNIGGKKVIDWSMVEFYYVDRDIHWEKEKHQNIDKEPLLVNKVDTWKLRPNATTEIPNLFLASDYVRTNTDLATMEGANEAARRAVNGILAQDNSTEKRCEVWPLTEPWFFIPLKWWDKKQFEDGKPYQPKKPIWLEGIMLIWGGAYAIMMFFKAILFWISTKLERWMPDLRSSRSKFALTAMAFAIGLLVYFSTFTGGYTTASIWGFGMFAVYVIYWLKTKDKIFGRLILFAITAGFAELFADAYLVKVTDTLVYPTLEPSLWESPLYMPFSWAVVLIQIGYIAWLLHGKLGVWKDGLMMVAFSAVLIPIYESLAIHAGWWSYQNAKMIGQVPIYIYLAEGLLMLFVPYFLMQCLKKDMKYSVVYGLLEGAVMLAACVIAIFITTKLF